ILQNSVAPIGTTPSYQAPAVPISKNQPDGLPRQGWRFNGKHGAHSHAFPGVSNHQAVHRSGSELGKVGSQFLSLGRDKRYKFGECWIPVPLAPPKISLSL